MTIMVLALCIGIVAVFLLKRLYTANPSAPLPPGPKGLPMLGNLLDLPSEKQWLTFAKWGETWGDIISVTLFGQTLIILNSIEPAIDMLDKKSSIYSDRPVIQMAGEMVGWKDNLGLLAYGDRFRRHRKHLHRLFGTHATMERFFPIEKAETHHFLRRITHTPDELGSHIRYTAGTIVLRISYGYQAEEENDPLIDVTERALLGFSSAAVQGAFLVDVLPILRYLPTWLPGSGFKAKAKVWAKDQTEMLNQPYDFVKEQMSAGKNLDSFTSLLLESSGMSLEEEADIKWAGSAVYAGGADTTVATINSFFVAMALYPEVQAKAQAEIDSVIGCQRLPVFADRKDLPYVGALCKEVFRFHTVAPTGLPHRVMEDDIHQGYFIPKGSLVIPNIWKMSHDPKVYSDPMVFNPERFMASQGKISERDPYDLCFGFGRRICPGKLLADASVFITCAMTLATCNITKCVDSVKLVYDQAPGVISHPAPFKCDIKPRSMKAADLILGEA